MSKKQKFKGLRLILGDQLYPFHSWFDDGKDYVYVLMEIKPESEYVKHHIQKIVGIFAAMRNFAEDLKDKDFEVAYFKINDDGNEQSFEKNIQLLYEKYEVEEFEYQEPDEWRLDEVLADISGGTMVSSEHFFTDRDEVETFFKDNDSYLMERFYRHMRKKHDILMEDGEHIGDKWNYDKSNRNKLPKDHDVTDPKTYSHDVSDIYQEVQDAGLESIGNIEPEKFIWPLTRRESLAYLNFFVKNMLEHFGDYQDALSNEYWSVYHSRISFSMNTKMLNPREVIEKVEEAFYERDEIDIATTEGFIRQILGWREYMRGLYWAKMPDYKTLNHFNNKRKLPDFYWTGDTKMNCLSKAIGQSLDHAYAHHIQRLMITGNFALLAGINPDEVDEWYLGIYIDAFEWVELMNTRGMSQFADGGIVATKPYVSSASYINKMGDYCSNCEYSHTKKTGESACPFNSLYWNFIDQHYEKFKNNARMGMMLATWDKMDGDKKESLLSQATKYLDNIDTL
ncbi:cryptochrome/photolyase family protein [Portibacter marinus]|uniref:cryptochrome/photolyase family protein n=1 Tax=Portibacter marinus TaxID=2898660 RepID=UPI001F320225|nr:cryptochrome/photolyase family protein [Portibacter marinus]